MHSVNYANERKQFGSLISNFGAIKYKLGDMVVRTWGIESALYRTARYVDDTIDMHVAQGMERTQAYLQAIGEYAMEAAILKVLGSESQDYIVDEAVQVHGGMGFSAEMPVDRCYRDSRINRIFEGTNEINRLVCADMLLKQAKKADSVIFAKAKEIYDSIDGFKNEAILTDDYFAYYEKVSVYLKQVVLLVMSRAYETLGSKYSSEQEVMMHISDIAIQAFAAESLYLRVKKLAGIYEPQKVVMYKNILDVFVYEAAARILKSASDAINSFAEGQEYSKLKNAVAALTMLKPINIKEARRKIADKLIEDNRYDF
jgi:hypothetical protein